MVYDAASGHMGISIDPNRVSKEHVFAIGARGIQTDNPRMVFTGNDVVDVAQPQPEAVIEYNMGGN